MLKGRILLPGYSLKKIYANWRRWEQKALGGFKECERLPAGWPSRRG